MSEVPSLLSMDVKPLISEDYFVRVRGLPFSTTSKELIDFFGDVNVQGGENGVTFTFTRDGRPSGEAYVCLPTQDDQATALNHNREHIGSRYIEVFEANRDEMEYVVKKSGPNPSNSIEGVLRLRGLPFGCSKEEIVQFFAGYEIVPNGITMTTDMHGRTSGDAYVQFANQDIAESAITEKHMKRIGHRYIELFRSTSMEAKQAGYGGGNGGPPGRSRPMRPAPYERPDRYGGGYGGGGQRGSGYDPYAAPRDRFSGSGGMSGGGGRYKEFGGGDRYSGSRGGSRGARGGRGGGGAGGGRGGGGGGGRGSASNGSNHLSSTGHSVHMRGLPFSADEDDISHFFLPLRPVVVLMGVNHEGRKSGEADVDFETHEEACEAMKKDKSHMEHRYIELFLNSSSSGTRGGGGSSYMRDDYSSGLPAPMPSRMGSSGYGGGMSNLQGGGITSLTAGMGGGGGISSNFSSGTASQGIFGFSSMSNQSGNYF